MTSPNNDNTSPHSTVTIPMSPLEASTRHSSTPKKITEERTIVKDSTICQSWKKLKATMSSVKKTIVTAATNPEPRLHRGNNSPTHYPGETLSQLTVSPQKIHADNVKQSSKYAERIKNAVLNGCCAAVLPALRRGASELIVNMKRGAMISLISVILSMVTNLYPSMPRCNVALAAMGLFLHVSKKQRKQPPRYYALYTLTIFFSLIVDLNTLISDDNHPAPLHPPYEHDSVLTSPDDDDATTIRRIASLSLFANMALKLSSLHYLTEKSRPCRKFKTRTWYHIHPFFIPTTRRLPKDLRDAARRRIVALIWIQSVSSLVMFGLGVTILTPRLNWSSHFSAPAPMLLLYLPLKVVVVLKGVTGTALTVCLLRDQCRRRRRRPDDDGSGVDGVMDFLAEFGCTRPCRTWYETRLRLRRGCDDDDGNCEEKVEEKGPLVAFAGCHAYVKGFDFIIGILTILGLARAYRLGGGASFKEVRVVLGLVSFAEFALDVWVVILGLTIYWYITMLRQREEIISMTARTGREDGTTPVLLAHNMPPSSPSSGSSRESSQSSFSSPSSTPKPTPHERARPTKPNYDDTRIDNNIATPDYDLTKNVIDSQTIFENRLQSAAAAVVVVPPQPPQHGPSTSQSIRLLAHQLNIFSPLRRSNGNTAEDDSDDDNDGVLDVSITITPSEFLSLWNELPSLRQYKLGTTKSPLLGEIQRHLEWRRFYVIASGVRDDDDDDDVTSRRNGDFEEEDNDCGVFKIFTIAQYHGKKCLMELQFDTFDKMLMIDMRCEEGVEAREKEELFIKCLDLRGVFGELEEWS